MEATTKITRVSAKAYAWVDADTKHVFYLDFRERTGAGVQAVDVEVADTIVTFYINVSGELRLSFVPLDRYGKKDVTKDFLLARKGNE